MAGTAHCRTRLFMLLFSHSDYCPAYYPQRDAPQLVQMRQPS